MRAGHAQSFPSPSPLPTDTLCVSVLIIAELAIGGAGRRRWNRNLEPNFCPGRGLIPEPHDWQSNTLTTRLPRTHPSKQKTKRHRRGTARPAVANSSKLRMLKIYFGVCLTCFSVSQSHFSRLLSRLFTRHLAPKSYFVAG